MRACLVVAHTPFSFVAPLLHVCAAGNPIQSRWHASMLTIAAGAAAEGATGPLLKHTCSKARERATWQWPVALALTE